MQAAEAKVAAAKSAFEQARKKQDETKDEYERAAFTNQQSPAVEKVRFLPHPSRLSPPRIASAHTRVPVGQEDASGRQEIHHLRQKVQRVRRRLSLSAG